ncbi:MAG TPA: hypothetical protein PKC30_15565 [Saprospiraceae bacterium]|nr:hypothetical protein [Saprospiraceae bacterium]
MRKATGASLTVILLNWGHAWLRVKNDTFQMQKTNEIGVQSK